MSFKRFIAGAAFALLGAHTLALAQTLEANTIANNGGSSGWAMFFDLTALTIDTNVTHLSTFNGAPAGGNFSIEVFTRTGTALGGPVGTGPGSSLDGWTSLGVAAATQGPVASGLSNLIDIPDIFLTQGEVTGVALLFQGASPRYFTAPALQTFSDSFLSLTTGDVRSAPFSMGGSYFSPRGFSGSLVYAPVPEPATWAYGLLGLAVLAAWRRRKG